MSSLSFLFSAANISTEASTEEEFIELWTSGLFKVETDLPSGYLYTEIIWQLKNIIKTLLKTHKQMLMPFAVIQYRILTIM